MVAESVSRIYLVLVASALQCVSLFSNTTTRKIEDINMASRGRPSGTTYTFKPGQVIVKNGQWQIDLFERHRNYWRYPHSPCWKFDSAFRYQATKDDPVRLITPISCMRTIGSPLMTENGGTTFFFDWIDRSIKEPCYVLNNIKPKLVTPYFLECIEKGNGDVPRIIPNTYSDKEDSRKRTVGGSRKNVSAKSEKMLTEAIKNAKAELVYHMTNEVNRSITQINHEFKKSFSNAFSSSVDEQAFKEKVFDFIQNDPNVSQEDLRKLLNLVMFKMGLVSAA